MILCPLQAGAAHHDPLLRCSRASCARRLSIRSSGPSTWKRCAIIYTEDTRRHLPDQASSSRARLTSSGAFGRPISTCLAWKRLSEEQGFLLLGADRLGRDMFSRVVYGARISLSIGLVGVFLSLTWASSSAASPATMAARSITSSSASIEFIRSIPTIPLWMG